MHDDLGLSRYNCGSAWPSRRFPLRRGDLCGRMCCGRCADHARWQIAQTPMQSCIPGAGGLCDRYDHARLRRVWCARQACARRHRPGSPRRLRDLRRGNTLWEVSPTPFWRWYAAWA